MNRCAKERLICGLSREALELRTPSFTAKKAVIRVLAEIIVGWLDANINHDPQIICAKHLACDLVPCFSI